ncbi:MAG: hypothetical protein ACLFVT_08755, partial [Syntrophobacteria bacterium]
MTMRGKPAKGRLGALACGVLAGLWVVLLLPGLSRAETVRDEFNSTAYNNNDGTNNWAGDWVEVNDDGSPDWNWGAAIFISGGELYLRRNGDPDKAIYREADLTGAISAVLTFDYRTLD